MKKERRTLLALAVSSLAAWVIVFAAGVLVDSRTFRDRLAPPQVSATQPSTAPVTGRDIAWNLLPAMLIYTPTNAAVLAALAGLAGGCASKLAVADTPEPKLPPQGDPERPAAEERARRRTLFMNESPFTSMLRGFVVYLTFLGGVLIAVSNPFDDPNPGSYLRYAGTVSLIAFIMGYDPTRFEHLLAQVPTFSPSGKK